MHEVICINKYERVHLIVFLSQYDEKEQERES